MIANNSGSAVPGSRIVITGVGITAPNGNSLSEYRDNLLAGRSGVKPYEIRYFGKTLAGICDFDALRHQARTRCPPRHTGRLGGSLLRP